MSRLLLRVTLQPEGGFVVTCPLLPELVSEGDSVEEAVANAEDALAAVIEAYEDLGRPLPAEMAVPGEEVTFETEVATNAEKL